MKRFIELIGITGFIILILTGPAVSEDKTWSASGDGTNWSDEDNWTPAVEPASGDDILIDAGDAAVVCTETFKAKSITMGGRETPSLTSNNFIFGTVSPDSGSGIAVLNRSGGTITLKGAGTLTLQGQYKDSEESLTPEPSFMFWIE